MIFVFDAGIALMSSGADGTANGNVGQSICAKQIRKHNLRGYVTVLIRCAEELFGLDAVANFGEGQHPHTVVGVLLQIFHSQILIR